MDSRFEKKYEWQEKDLYTEYEYLTGTIFHGHAAEILEELYELNYYIYRLCGELKEFVAKKYDGDAAAFVDAVAHCSDYYPTAPLLKKYLLKNN